MTQQTIMKLISAGAGIVLVAFGLALILTDNGEHSDWLLIAGIGLVTGGIATTSLPRLNEPRKEGGADPKPPRSSGGAAGPMLVLALALGASTWSGCGAAWLDAHAPVAQGLQDAQIASEGPIRELRLAAIDRAVRDAHAEGASREEAEAVRVGVERDWQCVVDGHRLYGTLVSTYIEALWLAKTTGREPEAGNGDGQLDPLDFVPFARRAIDGYRAIASCTGTLEHGDLPVPPALELVPPAWGVSRG